MRTDCNGYSVTQPRTIFYSNTMKYTFVTILGFPMTISDSDFLLDVTVYETVKSNFSAKERLIENL